MLGYLRWLATRRHLPPFVAPLLFSFCPMLMYRWCLAEGHGGDTGVLEEIMGVLYNREKEGVAMVLKNTELVFDTVFRRKVKGEEEGAKREGRDGRMDDERQKMEEGVFDVKKRIEKGPEVKFGYAEAKIIPGMVRVLRETIRGVREEVEGVDVVPMFDLMRKIMGLRLEEVAYSDELTEVRKEVQELCVRFSSDIIRVIRGSFYDMFGILIEEIKWKSDNVAISVAYLDLMSDHFLLFPKAYHISVIFEEPNILFILPKLIVWNEKQSKDATFHGAQKQKKQPQTKLFEEKITFDWVESLSKTNSGQKIVNYRKSMMRCTLLE